MQEEAPKGPSKAKRARKAEPGLRQGQSSRQKTALTPEQQIYNKLIVIPGVGPANAELFAKAGYTSVEAVLKTFQTTCSLNADHFREHLRVRICQQFTTKSCFPDSELRTISAFKQGARCHLVLITSALKL